MYKIYKLKDNQRLLIDYDDDMEDPRSWGNIGKLCIREHRRYNFPNELDYEWDSASEDADVLYNKYHIFELDCYEHGGITFSLSGEGMQCRFDTSSEIGFIAVPKKYNEYDCNEWSESKNKDKGSCKEVTSDEAEQIARDELETYNKYLSGEGYRYTVEQLETWTNSKGETKEEWEYVDGCGGYYDVEDIISEFKDRIIE